MSAELKSKVEDFLFKAQNPEDIFIIMQIMSNYFTNYAIILHTCIVVNKKRTQKRPHTPHNFINCDKLIIIYE